MPVFYQHPAPLPRSTLQRLDAEERIGRNGAPSSADTAAMTAQRLLKLLAVLSIASTAVAVFFWYDTGQPPPKLLLQVSSGAFLAALLTGLIGAETRPRMMLRFLAAICALAGVIAFVTDFSQQTEGYTSVAGHLSRLAPSLLAALKAGITRSAGVTAWEMASGLLSMPTFVAFAMLAAICGFASRPRQKLSIFVN